MLALVLVVGLCVAAGAPSSNPSHKDMVLTLFPQPVDHFSFYSNATFKQRVFSNNTWWKSGCEDGSPPGPLFFYTGNEGPVTLYTDSCGLMWENAPAYGAALTFAEHRYYGESVLFGTATPSAEQLQYLTHEQALADYVAVVAAAKADLAASASCDVDVDDIPVVSFGGSYGGMLSAFFRMRYPQIVDMAIAASAPIFGWEAAGYDSASYWTIVTEDASASGGSAPACADNIRQAFADILSMGATADGRATLSSVFQVCGGVADAQDATRLALYLEFAFDSIAMGDNPYPDTYISYPATMPAFPMRVACSNLAKPNMTGAALLEGMAAAAAVFNNASGALQCNPLPTDLKDDGLLWDYQYCTELFPEETYFNVTGVTDMFWRQEVTKADITAHCQQRFGVTPRYSWIRDMYGSADTIARTASNIVFSNGQLDPWRSGGVQASLSPSLPAVYIADSAHHTDLFFSNPADPKALTAARVEEMQYISKWLQEFRASRA